MTQCVRQLGASMTTRLHQAAVMTKARAVLGGLFRLRVLVAADRDVHQPPDRPHAPKWRALRWQTCAAWVLAPWLMLAMPAAAAPLTWAGQSDIQSLDPHAQSHSQTQAVLQHVYEGLTRYTPQLDIEPALATHWEVVSPLVWRFHIRPDVRFHDGTPLTASDVRFSLERIQQARNPLSAQFASIRITRVVNDHQIEIILDRPTPLLPRFLADARIMSQRWAQANHTEKVQPPKSQNKSNGVRHANGTGPFRIDSWTPDHPLRLERNPQWWDAQAFPGNVTTLTYRSIGPTARRIEALLAGEVDLITDLGRTASAAIERNNRIKVHRDVAQRTLLLGMDQHSDHLRHGHAAKGNPFKDQRVRRAMSLAISTRGFQRITGSAYQLAGSIVAPGVNGWSESLDRREPSNILLARQLMKEAGYADGFDVTIDCPNNRYAYDREICEALVPMWKRIGIRLTVNSLPFASLVPRLETLDSSLWMIGWGSPDNDALQNLLALTNPSEKVAGAYNATQVDNPELNSLINQARVQNDPDQRRETLQNALRIVKDQFYYLPLAHMTRVWLSRPGIELLVPPTERPDMRFIRVGSRRRTR